jgi:glutathione S-transferase
MHLYDSIVPSGNAYKINLMLAHLGIKYDTTSLDILATPSETRTPEFLKLNPNGRIPVLVLDDGTPLAESNAILYYLAEGTKYLPSDRLERAKVMQWLFFEQYSHEPYIAVWKYLSWVSPIGFSEREPKELERLKERGQAAIDVMERHLGQAEGRQWFVGGQMTIADVALYAYTHSAELTGFTVGEGVKSWLKRMEGLEGHVRIKKDPTGRSPL